MKYFVKIVSGIAVQVYRSDEKWEDDDCEITEEQFTDWVFPCRTEVTDNGVVFGDIVPWDEVPDTSVVIEAAPESEPLPKPESPEVSWDAMAEAIMDGVNDV